MPTRSALTAGGDAADTALAEEVNSEALPFQELGVTGLRRTGGYLDEEFLPQLKGRKAVQVYKEMAENSPIVGAMLFAIIQLLRNAEWGVTPAGKSREHNNAAKLLETAKDDMSHSWDDLVVEILSCLVFGWSWHEIVYKRRMGPWQRDGRQRSKYSDGLVGWRRMPIRSQETMQRWLFDETGGVRGMVQLAPPDYQTRVLPIERSLLFRYGAAKGSPEGRSMLRNAYRPWFYLKRLEEFESVGIERDLVGMPKATVPADWLRAPAGSPQAKQVEAIKKAIRGMRRNEQEGIVWPQAYDPDTNQPLFELELLGSGGQRQFQTDPIIKRYEERILMTVLADFIMVGHQRVGTYNLHLDKTGIFRTSLNATIQSIADVMNRHAVPRLFAANGWKPAELPKFHVSDVDAPDIAQLSQFLTATAGLGFAWGPDAELEQYLRRAAGLPPMSDDDEKRERIHARREEATRFAEGQTRYLAARSLLAQTQAQQEMQAAGEPLPEEMAAEEQAQMQAEQHQLSMAQGVKELKTPTPKPTAAKPAAKGRAK